MRVLQDLVNVRVFRLSGFETPAKDKRGFWAARRRAVGGRTLEESDDDDDDEESAADEDMAMEDELPEVGGGRGQGRLPETTLQPISFHTLPRMVMDSLTFAYWAQTCLDMTPGFGQLCNDMVLQKIGYIGICHSEQQRQYIEENAIKEILEAMKNADSKVYQVAYAKEIQEIQEEQTTKQGMKRAADTEAPARGKTPKAAKAEPSAAGAGTSSELSSALQQMLAAAKGGQSE